jgi:SPP1 family predicted phage head-tail adaptor
MNPGLFNKRIILQVLNLDVTDDEGFPIPDDQKWMEYAKVSAMIKTLKGREYYQAATIQAEKTTRFVLRYSKNLDQNLNEDMRILYNGKAFEIESIINDDEKNITFTIVGKVVT